MDWQERQLPLSHLKLTASGKFLSGQGQPTLCLHGWLDNANTFDHIAGHLIHRPLFSMDWLGHGYSDHFDDSHSYQMLDYLTQIFDAADALGWDKFHILGHSLGAAVGVLAAGLFPERILSFISVDSFGPLSARADVLPDLYKAHLSDKLAKLQKEQKGFASPEDAARLRARMTNLNLPSAQTMTKRALLAKENDGTTRYFWNFDAKLQIKSAHPLTEEQVSSFLHRVKCPVLFIESDKGLAVQYAELIEKRLQLIKNLQRVKLTGTHHLHMENVEEVAKAINDFWATV